MNDSSLFENSRDITHVRTIEGTPDRVSVDVLRITNPKLSYLLGIKDEYINEHKLFIRIKISATNHTVFIPYDKSSDWACKNHIETTYSSEVTCDWCGHKVEENTRVILLNITSDKIKTHLSCFTEIQSTLRQIEKEEHILFANLI